LLFCFLADQSVLHYRKLDLLRQSYHYARPEEIGWNWYTVFLMFVSTLKQTIQNEAQC
jgi:hypothetical protein